MTAPNINNVLANNNVQVPEKFANVSDRVDIVINENNIISNEIIPPLTHPSFLLWRNYYTEIYALDNGGPLSTATWIRYLERIAELGVDNGNAWEYTTIERAIWAANIVREVGLKVTMSAAPSLHYALDGTRPWRDTEVGHRGDEIDIYHTSYLLNPDIDPDYGVARCPNYRGIRYTNTMNRLDAYAAALMPDYVMCDDESFLRSPLIAERELGAAIITGCTRCGTHAVHEAGHAAVADEYQRITKQYNPNCKWSFFGPTQNWPGYSGELYAPLVYYVRDYATDPDEALELLRQRLLTGIGTTNFAYNYDFPTGKIIGSYPWIDTYWGQTEVYGDVPETDNGRYLQSPDYMYHIAKVCAECGALGVHIYGAPTGLNSLPSYPNHSEYWEEKKWELLEVIIAAFRDYYGATYRGQSPILI